MPSNKSTRAAAIALLLAGSLLVGASLFLACDDGGTNKGGTPAETTEAEVEAEPDVAAFDGVPVPSGAEETGSGVFRGRIPFAGTARDIDPQRYALEFKEYRLEIAPEEAVDFYSEKLDDWDEILVLSSSDAADRGGFGIWTRDEAETALWVGATIVDGETQLLLIRGTRR